MRGWLVVVLGFASEQEKYSEGNLQAQKNYCREPMYSASGINRDVNVTLWEKRHYTFYFLDEGFPAEAWDLWEIWK